MLQGTRVGREAVPVAAPEGEEPKQLAAGPEAAEAAST
jgi:hypothetical protein